MKKTALIAAAIFLISIFSGCYDGDETAKVRIKLGNMPVAQNFQKKSIIDRVLCFFSKEAIATPPEFLNLTSLHIAAFKNDVLLTSLNIDQDNFREDDSYELNVPAGKDVIIVVVGRSSNVFNHIYGEIKIDIEAGKTINAEISPDNLESALNFNRDYDYYFISWKKFPGAEYKITYQDVGPIIIAYNGTGTRVNLDSDTIGATFTIYLTLFCGTFEFSSGT